MENFITNNDNLFIRKGWLTSNEFFSVPKRTVKDWSVRDVSHSIYINRLAYINYHSIPAPTREKLPDLDTLRAFCYEEEINEGVEYYYNIFKKAQDNFPQYREIYKADERNFSEAKVTELAKLHAVWVAVLDEHQPHVYRQTTHMSKAYNKLYADKPFKGNRFHQLLGVAKREGIERIVCRKDDRASNPRNNKYGIEYDYCVAVISSSGKAYNMVQVWKKLNEVCQKQGMKTPCLSWVKEKLKKSEIANATKQTRYGKAVYDKENAPYSKMIPALNVGSQWQIDGWRLPFYAKRVNEKTGRMEYFVTYTLFTVLDSHSRKIVGYSIAESENTTMILEALDRAVKETGYLPFEIVSDNHTFHKTQEAKNLKAEMASMGVTFTVTEKPQYKSIVERSFGRIADNNCKDLYGYVGQGIKTKNKNGRTSQELIDQYTKPDNLLTTNEVVLNALFIVNEYNQIGIKKFNYKTPNELYTASETPHIVEVDFMERLKLFTAKTEYKVSRQQINITRAGVTYEYQLPAKLMTALNGTNVTVRYIDFDEIHLFDPETDYFICSLKQKQGIHGALADQTETDTELLNKQAGRTKGLKAKEKAVKEQLTQEAIANNPDVYEVLNQVMTPKNVLETAKQNHDLRRMAADMGLDLERIPERRYKSELTDTALIPKKPEKESPFAVKGHKISTYVPIEDEDDE